MRLSLETDVAREVEGTGAESFAGVLVVEVVGFCAGVGAALRLREMMLVSSCLKVSRSTYATA